MRKRKIQTLSKSQIDAVRGMQYLACDKCGDDVLVNRDVGLVICDYCVQTLVPAPELPINKPKSDKPRGWHFKKYFEHEGVVYSMGEVVTDKQLITALKKEHVQSNKIKPNASKRGRKNARTSK